MFDCSGSGRALKVGFYWLDVSEIRVRREDNKALSRTLAFAMFAFQT
jgi:hypothetical protein